jgi:hypothetical protein
MLHHTELYKPQPIVLNLRRICMLWSAYWNHSLFIWELKNSWMYFQIIWYCQISWNIFLPFEFLFTSDNFKEHCAWRLTCIAVHLNFCFVYVYIFISHQCACTVNVQLICTLVKPWAVWSIRFPFLAYGLLGVDQVWWIKWRQDIILNYWGKQSQCDVSNKWSRIGVMYYIVCYLYLIILFITLFNDTKSEDMCLLGCYTLSICKWLSSQSGSSSPLGLTATTKPVLSFDT